MLSHTARIHTIKQEALFRPFAAREAIDCSPPFKLALALRSLRPGWQRLTGKAEG